MELVYFLHAEGTNLVKIGWTADLARRFDQLQTGCPHTLLLLGVHLGTKQIEAIYHRDLACYRQRGEWFLLTSEVRRWLTIALNKHSESNRAFREFLYRNVESREDGEAIEARIDESESFCGIIGSQPTRKYNIAHSKEFTNLLMESFCNAVEQKDAADNADGTEDRP